MAYDAAFPIGTRVRVVDPVELAEFKRTWTFHHRLTDDQLAYGGRQAVVERVLYYHGGDILYILRGIPGIWHEVCLKPDS